MDSPEARLLFRRAARLKCPRNDCGHVQEFRTDLPLMLGRLPTVGSKVECTACKRPMTIAAECVDPEL
jgi:hypothetical protein